MAGSNVIVDHATPQNGLVVNIDGSINAVIVGGGGSGGTASTFGAAFPAVGTASGFIDASGNMAGANLDGSGNLKVAGSFSAGEATLSKTGSVSSAAVLFTQADTTGYYSCFFRIAGIGACTVVAEIENPTDGTWNAIEVAPVGTLIGQASVTTNGMYYCQTGGKGFRLRVSVYDSSATVTADAFFRGFGAMPFPSALAVTVASLPLPTGAATSALQTTGNTSLASIITALGSPFQAGGSIGNTSFAATQSGAWNITNISGTITLPTGAATAAKQPALGTAGTPSADVLSVQGVASMTALKVDGSATTQPVSGTVNQGAVTPVLKNGLTNTASSVVSSVAATLEDYYIYNPNASVAYVQIYDVATAGAVTVGTTTPKWSIGIPATSAANIARMGLSFASGIQVAATTTATGSTAPGTALDANFGYR